MGNGIELRLKKRCKFVKREAIEHLKTPSWARTYFGFTDHRSAFEQFGDGLFCGEKRKPICQF